MAWWNETADELDAETRAAVQAAVGSYLATHGGGARPLTETESAELVRAVDLARAGAVLKHIGPVSSDGSVTFGIAMTTDPVPVPQLDIRASSIDDHLVKSSITDATAVGGLVEKTKAIGGTTLVEVLDGTVKKLQIGSAEFSTDDPLPDGIATPGANTGKYSGDKHVHPKDDTPYGDFFLRNLEGILDHTLRRTRKTTSYSLDITLNSSTPEAERVIFDGMTELGVPENEPGLAVWPAGIWKDRLWLWTGEGTAIRFLVKKYRYTPLTDTEFEFDSYYTDWITATSIPTNPSFRAWYWAGNTQGVSDLLHVKIWAETESVADVTAYLSVGWTQNSYINTPIPAQLGGSAGFDDHLVLSDNGDATAPGGLQEKTKLLGLLGEIVTESGTDRFQVTNEQKVKVRAEDAVAGYIGVKIGSSDSSITKANAVDGFGEFVDLKVAYGTTATTATKGNDVRLSRIGTVAIPTTVGNATGVFYLKSDALDSGGYTARLSVTVEQSGFKSAKIYEVTALGNASTSWLTCVPLLSTEASGDTNKFEIDITSISVGGVVVDAALFRVRRTAGTDAATLKYEVLAPLTTTFANFPYNMPGATSGIYTNPISASNITATPTANAIPKAGADNQLAPGWLGTGTALQVVRRNAGNTALEFATVSSTPAAHASTHQHGGSDEVATATAAANSIPKSGATADLNAWTIDKTVTPLPNGVPATGDDNKALPADHVHPLLADRDSPSTLYFKMGGEEGDFYGMGSELLSVGAGGDFTQTFPGSTTTDVTGLGTYIGYTTDKFRSRDHIWHGGTWDICLWADGPETDDVFVSFEIKSHLLESPYTDTTIATTSEQIVSGGKKEYHWYHVVADADPTSGGTYACQLQLVVKVRNSSASSRDVTFYSDMDNWSYVKVPFSVAEQKNDIATVLGYGSNATNRNITNLKQITYNSCIDDGNTGASKTINWTNGHVHKCTATAAGFTLTFTAPSGPARLYLIIMQDGTGRSFGGFSTGGPLVIGNAETLSTTPNSYSLWEFFYDGTNYWRKLMVNGAT